MKDRAFPLDDSKIEIFINSRSDQVKPIFLQFKITKFTINGSEYSITGVLDVNYLYLKSFKSYNSTSFYALQSMCKEGGLGFNSNFDDTNDSMAWLNTGQRSLEFIESIVETSYKSDQSFLYFYIDYYYNLNYIDIEKELNRNIKEDLGIGNIGIEDALKTSNPEVVSKLFLTNDLAMAESNSFFESYKILNNSTSTSIKEGYKTKMKYYDEKAKSFLIFDVGSITDKDQKSIILKGAPGDESFYNDNTQYVYTGRIDTDNMHQNYHYSYIQNTRNLIDLQKVGLEIVMKTPNFNIYRFQKVFLFLSNQISTPSAPQINSRLTGEWLIVDISYKYDGSSFRQIVKLLKRELELSPEELANEPDQNQPAKNTGGDKTSNDNGQINENPIVPTGTQSSTPGATSSTPIDDSQFPLTKEIFRQLYKTKPKIVELWYEPLKSALIKNGITSKERIAAFLSQISIESGFILYTTERGTSAGSEYEGRKDLGNTNTGDGMKYKGRGLLQITGRYNYSKASQYFNRDFVNDTSLLAAENPVHQRYADTPDQIQNAINASVWFWLKGSVRGNLNKYADKMDIKKPFNFGGTTIDALPESSDQSRAAAKQYGIFTKKNPNDIATYFSPNDPNFVNFTMICLGINGGYIGFQSRCKNWLQIREYFK
jgi:predicted chitinase